MNAVFSFWSKPFLETGKVQRDVESPVFINSWIYSVNHAKKNFKNVILYTDDFGFQFLCKKLNLKFDKVFLSLNELSSIPNYLWAYGKIFTYQSQTEPFIHIDYDAFLTKPLMHKFLNAELLVESIELFKDYHLYYPLIENLKLLGYSSPIFDLQDNYKFAYNAGILGGTNLDFIKLYCLEASNIVDFMIKKNFDKVHLSYFSSVVFEQSNLVLCAMYYGVQPTVFCQNNKVAEETGYCHLKGAKKDPGIAQRLSKSIFYHFPESYWSLQHT